MSPTHEFYLVDRRDFEPRDFAKFIHTPSEAQIDDDVLQFFHPFLNWIPTLNPAKNDERQQGLCYYGPTVIGPEGASNALKIFSALADLYSAGSQVVPFTGTLEHKAGKSVESDEPEDIHLESEEIAKAFRTIAGFANTVLRSSGRYFILHLGI